MRSEPGDGIVLPPKDYTGPFSPSPQPGRPRSLLSARLARLATRARLARSAPAAKQLDGLRLFDTRKSTTDCNRKRIHRVAASPLRLLHVVPTYLPAVRYGGPIRSVHALCRALAADGHDVHVFTTNVDGPADSDVPLRAAGRSRGRQGHLLSRAACCVASIGRRRCAARSPHRSPASMSCICTPSISGRSGPARAPRARAGVPYVISPRGMLVPELIRRKSRWVKAAWIALIERANLEARCRHPRDVVGRGGPSRGLRLVAAADRHHSARRRRSAAAFRLRRCRPISRPRSRRARWCWRSAASAGRRGSIA